MTVCKKKLESATPGTGFTPFYCDVSLVVVVTRDKTRKEEKRSPYIPGRYPVPERAEVYRFAWHQIQNTSHGSANTQQLLYYYAFFSNTKGRTGHET